MAATATSNRAAKQIGVRNSTGIARNGSPRSLRLSPHQAKVIDLEKALARGNAKRVAQCYVNLGDALTSNERATIRKNGTAISVQKKDCYVAALASDANSAYAFNNLGATLGPNERIDVTLIDGAPQSFNEKECYLAALERDASFASAFNNLGTTLGPNERIDVTLNDGAPQSFNQKECYLAALEIDANFAFAFNGLGTTLGPNERIDVTLNDGAPQSFNNKECFLAALAREANFASAFNNLGITLGPNERIDVTFNDGAPQSFNNKECYLAALERDANSAFAFTVLGNTLGPNERIDVTLNDGAPQSFNQKECFLAALAREANFASAFNNLGITLGPNERIDVTLNDGAPQSFNQKECYLAALERDANFAYAFYNLGTSLRTDEKIYIKGVEHANVDCLQRALNLGGFPEDVTNRIRDELAALKAIEPARSLTPPTSPIAPPTETAVPTQPPGANTLPTETMQRWFTLLPEPERVAGLIQHLELQRVLHADYNAPTDNTREYYRVFNQAMERTYHAAHSVGCGLLTMTTSGTVSAAQSAAAVVPINAVATTLGVLLSALDQHQQTKVGNELNAFQMCFKSQTQCAQIAHEVARAVCEHQGNALDDYREDVTTRDRAYPAGIASSSAPSESLLISLWNRLQQQTGFANDNHLNETPIGRKALRDIGNLVKAMLELDGPEREQMVLDPALWMMTRMGIDRALLVVDGHPQGADIGPVVFAGDMAAGPRMATVAAVQPEPMPLTQGVELVQRLERTERDMRSLRRQVERDGQQVGDSGTVQLTRRPGERALQLSLQQQVAEMDQRQQEDRALLAMLLENQGNNLAPNANRQDVLDHQHRRQQVIGRIDGAAERHPPAAQSSALQAALKEGYRAGLAAGANGRRQKDGCCTVS